jgi:hypothetical protein
MFQRKNNRDEGETCATRIAKGIEVDFTIDDEYLVAHTLATSLKNLFCSARYQDDIRALQACSLGLSQSATEFIQIHQLEFLWKSEYPDLKRADIAAHLAQLKGTSAFDTIRQQTAEFLAELRAGWVETLKQSSEILCSMTGLKFDGERYSVIVTHPSLCQGMYLGNKRIAWGGADRWPNYSTVYLWHEIFHDLLGKSDVSHAIIELLTDNELRVRLNGGSYPPFEGHVNLNPLKEKILPYWQEFIKGDLRNIFAFEQRMLDVFKGEAASSVW